MLFKSINSGCALLFLTALCEPSPYAGSQLFKDKLLPVRKAQPMTVPEQMCYGRSQHKIISKEICPNAFFNMPVSASCKLLIPTCWGWGNAPCELNSSTRSQSHHSSCGVFLALHRPERAHGDIMRQRPSSSQHRSLGLLNCSWTQGQGGFHKWTPEGEDPPAFLSNLARGPGGCFGALPRSVGAGTHWLRDRPVPGQSKLPCHPMGSPTEVPTLRGQEWDGCRLEELRAKERNMSPFVMNSAAAGLCTSYVTHL